jgi:hypothetical protein
LPFNCSRTSRFDALRQQPLRHDARLRLVDGFLDLAARPDALAHLVPQAPRHQRRRLVVLQVVHHRDAQATHLEHIAEPFGGDERGLRALVLEDGVGSNGSGMHHRIDLARRDAEGVADLAHRAEDRAAVVVGSGRDLERAHRAGAAQHDVGEGAADVAAEDVARHAREYFTGLMKSRVKYFERTL